MRKFSLFLLLATGAVPVMAQSRGNDDPQSRRAAPTEQSEKQVQQAERAQRSERSPARAQRQPQQQQQRPVVAERSGGRSGNDPAGMAMRERYQQAQQQQVGQQQRQSRRSEGFQGYTRQQEARDPAARSGRPVRDGQRQIEAYQQAQGGGLVPRQDRIRTIPSTRPQAGQIGPVRHDVRSGRHYDRNDRNRWSNNWRNDRRYDWRSHRDRNRFIFRIGFYSDPFGYGYRRFGLGSYLYPSYYQSNYWISDPWQYRLPPAYGPYRWIRYHNDAVLIDTWTGEVVDVIYGFFW